MYPVVCVSLMTAVPLNHNQLSMCPAVVYADMTSLVVC